MNSYGRRPTVASATFDYVGNRG